MLVANLSEYIADVLKSLGVEMIFTVSAESILPLLRSLLNKDIKIINSVFEPSAGFMALVYSRVRRKPGIIVTTSGPGALGSISPVAQALVEGDPILIISTVAFSKRGTAMHQFPDMNAQLSSFRSLTKASFRINKVNEVKEVLTKAFNIMLSGKPGPVYIEIPDHLLTESIDEKDIYVSTSVVKPEASISDVRKVAELLAEAEYPVILAGRGVYLSSAKELLINIAEMLSAPITVSIMAKGLISPEHKLYAGVAAGKAGNLVAYEIIKKADVILAVGNRFSEMGTGRYSLEINGKLIHINIDPYDLGRAFKPYLSILADAKDFLEKLRNELSKMKLRSRDYILRELSDLWENERKEINSYYSEERLKGLIKPWEVVKAVREVSRKGESIFIGDIGAHRIETFLMDIYENELYITSTSYVSMGLAVPGSVAASIACPDKDVVAMVGDGGFLMTGLEIATAVRYRSKPKVVVFNDSSYRVLSIYEKVRYKNVSEPLTKLPYIDFSLLANSLGAKGVRIVDRKELRRSLEEAFTLNEPVVIDINIDPKAVPIPFQRLYKISSI